MIKRVILIGAGNVATHLGQAFVAHGVEVVQVYSRTLVSARSLAEKLHAEAIDSFLQIKLADAYIFSVKDDALPGLIAQFPLTGKVMLHTAGSVNMKIFAQKTDSYGVFYPLQTFSKSQPINFQKVPLCLEVSDEQLRDSIMTLAEQLSESVYWMTQKQREAVHLAAVFACNFANSMYTVAQDFLQHHDVPFDLLRPLIQETANKVMCDLPSHLQTGPAVRNDQHVMQKHFDALSAAPEWQKLYRFVSSMIIQRHKNVEK